MNINAFLTSRIRNNPFSLSGSALKLIALVSMVIDHYAFFLVRPDSTSYSIMRCLGRIAFPVFAFLIAEGFAHTRNRTRYFLTILAFAFISEIPWFFLLGNNGTHNVLFTLALGVAALALFERLNGPVCFVAMLMMCGAGYLLKADYNWRGVMMIILFYTLRPGNIGLWKDRFKIDYSLRVLLQIIFTFPLMMQSGILGAMLASIVIFLYDGTRGSLRGTVAKYGFYAFYPLHLFYFCFYFGLI